MCLGRRESGRCRAGRGAWGQTYFAATSHAAASVSPSLAKQSSPPHLRTETHRGECGAPFPQGGPGTGPPGQAAAPCQDGSLSASCGAAPGGPLDGMQVTRQLERPHSSQGGSRCSPAGQRSPVAPGTRPPEQRLPVTPSVISRHNLSKRWSQTLSLIPLG